MPKFARDGYQPRTQGSYRWAITWRSTARTALQRAIPLVHFPYTDSWLNITTGSEFRYTYFTSWLTRCQRECKICPFPIVEETRRSFQREVSFLSIPKEPQLTQKIDGPCGNWWSDAIFYLLAIWSMGHVGSTEMGFQRRTIEVTESVSPENRRAVECRPERYSWLCCRHNCWFYWCGVNDQFTNKTVLTLR